MARRKRSTPEPEGTAVRAARYNQRRLAIAASPSPIASPTTATGRAPRRQAAPRRRRPSNSNARPATTRSTDPTVPDPSGTCHFLKLPAELRVNVYEMILGATYKRGQILANLPIPAIAHINKETRNEVLPLHFETTGFQVAVGTNSNQPGRRHRRESGTLGLHPNVTASLRDDNGLGEHGALRNITFLIYSSADIQDARQKLPAFTQEAFRFLIARLHITVEKKGEVKTQRLPGVTHHPALREIRDPEVFDECFASAEAMAREIAEDDDFSGGFKVDDLLKIAMEFRVQKAGSKASEDEQED
ncbi:hypothetical protein PRZ48_004724 [Zasmidium cellare]|uniref:Uncharacterized protein n=1 Tax=Zasmidium cellare TaxID=395010 RepID=A0ABR0EQC4_ZASCE|nr:hypothetical protein PRZ48_004724 [Zasmidium cellare]